VGTILLLFAFNNNANNNNIFQCARCGSTPLRSKCSARCCARCAPGCRRIHGAHPKLYSASTHPHDARLGCRVRRKHILWVEGGRECSLLSARKLPDGPRGGQVGLTSLPKAVATLSEPSR